jgi:hypothetical protein
MWVNQTLHQTPDTSAVRTGAGGGAGELVVGKPHCQIEISKNALDHGVTKCYHAYYYASKAPENNNGDFCQTYQGEY